ncbi:MAG: hypothetical protein ACLGI6_10835 [Gammaproteobacteria bacterium]
MKNEDLTTDEYDALEHIEKGARHDRVNACVGRNAKRLSSLKMIDHARNGSVALTDKGRQVLLLRRCIDGLAALAQDANAALAPGVAQFLSMKSHIEALPDGGFRVTDKGRETLANIEATRPQKRG